MKGEQSDTELDGERETVAVPSPFIKQSGFSNVQSSLREVKEGENVLNPSQSVVVAPTPWNNDSVLCGYMGNHDSDQFLDKQEQTLSGLEPEVENSLPVFPCLVASTTQMFVDITIDGVPARALFDTGATLSCISIDFLSR